MSSNRSQSSSPIPLHTLQRPSSPTTIIAVSSTLSVASSTPPQQSTQHHGPSLTINQAATNAASSSSAALPQSAPSQTSSSIIHRLIKLASELAKSFSRTVLLITLVIAVLGTVTAWKSYILSQWTARKDFFEFCRSYNDTLFGPVKEKCEKAILEGINPPPYNHLVHLKRSPNETFDQYPFSQPHIHANEDVCSLPLSFSLIYTKFVVECIDALFLISYGLFILCLVCLPIFCIPLILILIVSIALSLAYLVFVTFDPIISSMCYLVLIIGCIALRIVFYGMSCLPQQNLESRIVAILLISPILKTLFNNRLRSIRFAILES